MGGERGRENVFEEIRVKFSKFDKNYNLKDSRSPMNSKHKKHKDN